MLILLRNLLLILFLLMLSARASAEWWQARTSHFVLHIDDTEQHARDFAERLERFDAAMRKLYGVRDDPERLLRPVTVYVLRADDFQAACRCYGAVGVSYFRTTGSFILSLYDPKVDAKVTVGALSSQTVLLHEYSHQFMAANFTGAYPYWFSEGFAEFNANVTFEGNGSLRLGYPANYRGEALLKGAGISMKKLLSPEKYGLPDDPALVYARGWLLTHNLMLNPARSGQLNAYIAAINQGTPSYQAAQQAFGDLKKLDVELDAYMHGKLPLRTLPPPEQPIAVEVTRLSDGVAAMQPVYTTFRVGISSDYLYPFALKAAAIGRKYPDDAVVQTQLSDIELVANRLDQADAAADRAMALAPDSIDALVNKGRIAVARLRKSKSADDAAWKSARSWFLTANRKQPNAVTPLYFYYRSFIAAHAKPTAGAVKGLSRAAVLAPDSVEIRLWLARQELIDGDPKVARTLLAPIAFSPHYGLSENVTRKAMDLIDAGKIEEAKITLFGKDDD